MRCCPLCVLVLEGLIETLGRLYQLFCGYRVSRGVALLVFVLQRESSFSAIMAADELLCCAKAGKDIATLNNTPSISKHDTNDEYIIVPAKSRYFFRFG